MPNLIHAIAQHNKEWQSWCREKEYKDAMVIFKIKKPKCDRCGRPTQTTLHRYEDYLHGFEGYLAVVLDLSAEAGCNICNYAERKGGMKPCSGCVKAHQITNGATKIRYIPQFMEMCGDCCDPGEKALRKQEQENFDAHIKKARKEKNERDRIARRPYQDEQNLRRREFYRTVVKKH
jgi:hypothetical protein